MQYLLKVLDIISEMKDSILEKIDQFFTQYKYHTYKKGELLIRAEENPLGIFYLKSGFVREYAISVKGDEIVLNIFKPFAFFPMSFAINKSFNPYFFEAAENIEVWIAPVEEVVKFIKNNPDVLFDLLSRVYKGTDGLLTRMTYLMSGNAYERLIIELLIYAKRFGNGEARVEIKISEKDLAAQSGMTRETVSREMKLLKEKGLIKVDNSTLAISNLTKLEAELALE